MGCLFALLAVPLAFLLLGGSHLPDPRSDAAFRLFFGLVAFVVLGYLLGKGVARLRHRSKVRFVRTYEHD